MKIRNLPYGYSYIDGKINLHPQESVMVTEIFQEYLAGKSLLKIANELNKKKIEYMVGVINWNKARLKRIIEDKRYVGQDDYPNIIQAETYKTAQRLRSLKNTQKSMDRKATIFQINVPVRCPKCHSEMRRRHGNEYTHVEKWICKNNNCHHMIAKKDANLLEEVITLLNEVIAKPEKLQVPIETKCEQSGNLRILDNEIARMYDSIDIDKEELQKKLLKYASLRYIELNAEVCRTQRLKDRFKEASPTETFPAELFDKTVKELNLYTDGSIGIVLMNDQEIKREG